MCPHSAQERKSSGLSVWRKAPTFPGSSRVDEGSGDRVPPPTRAPMLSTFFAI